MIKHIVRLVVTVTILAIGLVGLQSPAHAAPAPAASTVSTGLIGGPVKTMDIDWGWYNATVWYSKYETQRIVATNGACSVVVGKAPGWVAKVLSGACGLVAVWAGYALARNRCVGVKVSYFMAIPYDWTTRAC